MREQDRRQLMQTLTIEVRKTGDRKWTGRITDIAIPELPPTLEFEMREAEPSPDEIPGGVTLAFSELGVPLDDMLLTRARHQLAAPVTLAVTVLGVIGLETLRLAVPYAGPRRLPNGIELTLRMNNLSRPRSTHH
jgi:hypothetical protein